MIKKNRLAAVLFAAVVCMSGCTFSPDMPDELFSADKLGELFAADKLRELFNRGGDTEKQIKLLTEGFLDEIYQGAYNEAYARLVNISEGECRATYENGLRQNAENFCTLYDIEYPDEQLLYEISELYADILSHAEYSVGEPLRLDEETYVVKVRVRPIDIFSLADEKGDEYLGAFYARYADTDIYSMSDREYRAFDRDWAETVIDMFKELLPELGYLPEKSVVLQICDDGSGTWAIAENDLITLDSMIINYD